jgi:hypothetical protein
LNTKTGETTAVHDFSENYITQDDIKVFVGKMLTQLVHPFVPYYS